MNSKKSKLKKPKPKKIDFANLGIILGQMSYATKASMGGKAMKIVEEQVFDCWMNVIRKLIEQNA